MEIKHNKTETKGKFSLIDTGKEIGELTYSIAGKDKIIIDHTEVGDDHEGQGLAKKLVMAAVEYARENKIKILPLCPYAKKVLNRGDEFKDILV